MANLYVTEFVRLTIDGAGQHAVIGSPARTQTVAIGVASASVALRPATRFVRLYSEAGCCVAFADAPVATTADIPLATDQTEYFGVAGGSVAVIQRP